MLRSSEPEQNALGEEMQQREFDISDMNSTSIELVISSMMIRNQRYQTTVGEKMENEKDASKYVQAVSLHDLNSANFEKILQNVVTLGHNIQTKECLLELLRSVLDTERIQRCRMRQTCIDQIEHLEEILMQKDEKVHELQQQISKLLEERKWSQQLIEQTLKGVEENKEGIQHIRSICDGRRGAKVRTDRGRNIADHGATTEITTCITTNKCIFQKLKRNMCLLSTSNVVSVIQ